MDEEAWLTRALLEPGNVILCFVCLECGKAITTEEHRNLDGYCSHQSIDLTTARDELLAAGGISQQMAATAGLHYRTVTNES